VETALALRLARTRQTLEKDLRTEDSFRNKRIMKMENELKAYANVNQEIIVCVLDSKSSHHTVRRGPLALTALTSF
jgi:hypothetical protein